MSNEDNTLIELMYILDELKDINKNMSIIKERDAFTSNLASHLTKTIKNLEKIVDKQ
jgi:hypothetical protein